MLRKRNVRGNAIAIKIKTFEVQEYIKVLSPLKLEGRTALYSRKTGLYASVQLDKQMKNRGSKSVGMMPWAADWGIKK